VITTTTRSSGNVVYEFDGRSALGLYKTYLGEHATGLPATGLLFPLSLRTADGTTGVVRTILSIDEHDQSMTFAGGVPEGAYARLMKANVDRLIDGAVGAARASRLTPDVPPAYFRALLHDEAARRRHRSRPGDRLWHRQAERWHHPRAQRGRCRHVVQDLLPRGSRRRNGRGAAAGAGQTTGRRRNHPGRGRPA
jgi:hypothetical protein